MLLDDHLSRKEMFDNTVLGANLGARRLQFPNAKLVSRYVSLRPSMPSKEIGWLFIFIDPIEVPYVLIDAALIKIINALYSILLWGFSPFPGSLETAVIVAVSVFAVVTPRHRNTQGSSVSVLSFSDLTAALVHHRLRAFFFPSCLGPSSSFCWSGFKSVLLKIHQRCKQSSMISML